MEKNKSTARSIFLLSLLTISPMACTASSVRTLFRMVFHRSSYTILRTSPPWSLAHQGGSGEPLFGGRRDLTFFMLGMRRQKSTLNCRQARQNCQDSDFGLTILPFRPSPMTSTRCPPPKTSCTGGTRRNTSPERETLKARQFKGPDRPGYPSESTWELICTWSGISNDLSDATTL